MSRAPRSPLEATLRRKGRPLLCCYLTAGAPDLATSLQCMLEAARAGADLLEVGIPFSDPVMDGPVIQKASALALSRGLKVADALSLLGEVVAATGVPAVAMTYYNPVLRAGVRSFARSLREAGALGAVIPDLPPEEAGEWMEAAAGEGLATAFFASPTSSTERLALAASSSTGFVYAVSTLGVTGPREELAMGARALVERVKALTDLPVLLGFGLSRPSQAAEAASFSDGVIVGSALVSLALEGPAEGAPGRVAALVGELRRALDGAGTL